MLLDRIPFPKLLDDLVGYGKEKTFELKVKRIYWLAIRRRKHDLARKIEAKYPRILEVSSDMAIAFGYALAAEKHLKEKKDV